MAAINIIKSTIQYLDYDILIVGLCQGRQTELRTLVTFDTTHCSDRNTV